MPGHQACLLFALFRLCGTTEQLPECRRTSRLLSELGKVGSSGRLGLEAYSWPAHASVIQKYYPYVGDS